jgi:hypothetical protein
MITDIWAATLLQVSDGGSTYHWEAYDSKSLNQSLGMMVEKNGTCSAITMSSCNNDERVCERECNELTNCNWCRGMEGHPTCDTYVSHPAPRQGCTQKLDPSKNAPGVPVSVYAWNLTGGDAHGWDLTLVHNAKGEPECNVKDLDANDPAARFKASVDGQYGLSAAEYENATYIGGRGAIQHWGYVYDTKSCVGDPTCTCLDDPHTHYDETTTTNATFTIVDDGTLQQVLHHLHTVRTGCRNDTTDTTITKSFRHLGTPTVATFDIGGGGLTCKAPV